MVSEGLLRNIDGVLDAVNFPGEGATTQPNPNARNGDAIRAYGSDKTLFDTKYMAFSEFNGPHSIYARAFSNITDGTPAITTEVWMRDKDGVENMVSRIDDWVAVLAENGGLGIGRGFFHENYQHRIVIKTSPTLSDSEYIDLDYVRLMPTDLWSVSTPIFKYNPSYNVPAMLNVRLAEIEITGDGSSDTYTATYSLPFETVAYWVTPTIYESAGKIYPVITAVNSDNFTVAATHKSSNWSGTVNVVCTIFSFETPVSL
jgi:hypothetical protein